MKKTVLFSALATGAVVLGMSSCNCRKSASLKNEIDSVSYAFGVNVGTNIKQSFDYMKEQDSIELNIDDFMAAFTDIIDGDSSKVKMSAQEAMGVMQAFGAKMQEKAMKKQQEESRLNKDAGDKFLAEKEKEEGVQKTASGLLYKVEKQGTGAKPSADSRVKVNYKGTLIDGTVFDSSYDRKEPAVFGVNQVIPGWTEGLQLMNVGSKYIFYIPANLAYGERQSGQLIKPNSTLVFEVELLSIEK